MRAFRQRHVAPNELDLVAVLFLESGESRLDALAEGALEVREDRDRDLGVLAALDRRVGASGCNLARRSAIKARARSVVPLRWAYTTLKG